MQESEVRHAVATVISTAKALGLMVDDAIVLHNSNRVALRLLPCDTLARVAPVQGRAGAEFDVELAQRLANTQCPVEALDARVEPRIYVQDGFVMTLWVYYEPVSPREITAGEYAHALERLHGGLRHVEMVTPHFTERIAKAQWLVENRDRTPDLSAADRDLLLTTLCSLKRKILNFGAPEQLLHGEPHPGNVLKTKTGVLLVDLETCCRGPVEFDIAHAPDEVSQHYPHVDKALIRDCRVLIMAMVATWRGDRDDQFPNGRNSGVELLSALRTAVRT